MLRAKRRAGRSGATVKMISVDLYVAGTDDPIAVLANGLDVAPENRFAEEDDRRGYEFFTREENALAFWVVEGDFPFKVDLYLFQLDWPALECKLRDLSTRGLVIAVDDEDSESPFDAVIYEGGEKRKCSIVDEVVDEEADRVVVTVYER